MRREFNYEPLTPTAFLHRSANVFPDRIGVVDGDIKFAYGEFLERCLRFAGALRAIGVQPGDRVALLAGNSHVMLAAHYAVPFSGGVLVALNTRITPADMAFILQHSGSSVLIYDDEFAKAATAAGAQVGKSLRLIRASGANDELEGLIADGKPLLHPVADERGMLAINYTSGTTARPKGVMYHHRGAYLQALAMAVHMGLTSDSVHLWTLPMFHCNGWCFPWAVTATGGMHLCLPKLDASSIWRHMRESGVTHFCAAPTVLTMTIWDPRRHAQAAAPGAHRHRRRAPHAGAARAARRARHGHHASVRPDRDVRPVGRLRLAQRVERAADSRAGAAQVAAGRRQRDRRAIRVVDDDGADVPPTAQTMGEIAIRGNNVMLGYYNDEETTRRACPDGWFRTGDLGVMYPDGYIELRDRAKDIIISGGENISSVEIEHALTSHAAVLEVAVVAAPDEKWGEVPVAFVTLKEGATATDAELIDHVRKQLARFKAPKRVIFGPLPKTATGKVQKKELRDRLRAA